MYTPLRPPPLKPHSSAAALAANSKSPSLAVWFSRNQVDLVGFNRRGVEKTIEVDEYDAAAGGSMSSSLTDHRDGPRSLDRANLELWRKKASLYYEYVS